MKYMVNVNNRYLVSVDVDGSAPAAEHKCLDLDGIATAMAYDAEMMKTDTFLADCMTLETIAWWDLADKSRVYACRWQSVGDAMQATRDAMHLVADLEKELAAAKVALQEAEAAEAAAFEYARDGNEKIGLPRVNT